MKTNILKFPTRKKSAATVDKTQRAANILDFPTRQPTLTELLRREACPF